MIDDPLDSEARGALVPDGAPHPALLGFVEALLDDPSRQVGLASLSFDEATLSVNASPVVAIVDRGEQRVLRARIERVEKGLKRGKVDVVVLGGDTDTQRWLAQLRLPSGLFRAIRVYHLPDGGEPWSAGPRRGATWRALGIVAERGGPATPWEALAPRLREALTRTVAEQIEWARFRQERGGRTPPVTLSLCAAIGLVFILQLLWGGTSSGPSLYRMGALSAPALAEDGEWWRLMSTAFLHGGFIHLYFNLLVLWLLGGFVEVVLGGPRFLALWGLSALGGSLASAFVTEPPLSVGASGALWGILVAHVVLAYHPRGLIPKAILPRAKRAAILNLGLNLFASFLPQIDYMAHFGGGIAGGLVLVGFLLVGVPTSREGLDADRRPVWLMPLTGLIVLAMVGSVATSIIVGKPWELVVEPNFERQQLGETEVSIEIPTLLFTRPVHVEGEMTEASFGKLLRDPLVIGVEVRPAPASIGGAPDIASGLSAAYPAERTKLLEELEQVGASVVGDGDPEPYETEPGSVALIDLMSLHQDQGPRAAWLLQTDGRTLVQVLVIERDPKHYRHVRRILQSVDFGESRD